MPSYHLEVLNDKEFEELSKDILEKDLKVKFQIFKTGRDGGIDLRYANTYENEIIVQAKRYVRSTFSNLKISLEKERIKMQKLTPKPKRYVLTTTFDLTIDQVNELVKIMNPFINSSQDIYPLERIMNLIADTPDIEKKYYKLWLTSTNILTQILNNGVAGRSDFIKEKILKKASLYVPTINFNTAVEKLKENHFLIISGEPGIGKTTISYLLICDLLAKDYQLVYVDDHLKDAEDLLSLSPDVKQVIFFDDFLGANLSEIMNPRNTESKITSFIERIQSSPNKYLIMTTRTTILRQAQHRFEKFNRSGLADLSKYEMEIKSYTKLDKAKILYNHLFHSGMETEQYDVFFTSQNYLKIINHDNYFPRLIEFITSTNQLKTIPINETEAFIFQSLNNPTEIWHSAYNQQLNEEERFLLMTLFSLGGYLIESPELEKAFESRYAYEIRENGFSLRTDAYQQSLRKLLDGFIRGEKQTETDVILISFLNPSVADFIINFLKERFSEIKRIIFSIALFKQITRYFSPLSNEKIGLNPTQLKIFYPQFVSSLPTLSNNSKDLMSGNIEALYILLYFFGDITNEEQIFKILSETEVYYSSYIELNEIIFVLSKLHIYPICQEYIIENWQSFFQAAIELCADSYDISKVLSLFNYYYISANIWSSDSFFLDTLKDQVNTLYTTENIDLSSRKDEIFEDYYQGHQDRALEIVESEIIDDYQSFLFNCDLSNYFDDFHVGADLDGETILQSFLERMTSLKDDYKPSVGFSGISIVVRSEDEAIRQLFER